VIPLVRIKRAAAALAIVLCLASLNGCSKLEYKLVSGTETGDYYEITPPEDWKTAVSKGVTIYTIAEYPDTDAYISINTQSDAIIDETLRNKDSIETTALNTLNSKYNNTASFTVFEESSLNGARCVHTEVTYTSERGNVEQSQYMFDSTGGGIIFSFVSVDGKYSSELSKTINSIKIK
jgi:hypothetical protein